MESRISTHAANRKDRLAPLGVSACVKGEKIQRIRWAWGGDTRAVESFGSPLHLGSGGFQQLFPEISAVDTYTKEGVTDSLTRTYEWVQGGITWTARAHSPALRAFDVETKKFNWRASRRSEYRLMYIEQSVLAAPVEDTVIQPLLCEQEIKTDRVARIKRQDSPLFPQQAADLFAPGVVQLIYHVNERGRISEIVILRGHPFFEETTIDAVRRWKFDPMLVDGCTYRWTGLVF